MTREFIDWDSPPFKEEAGTPNAMAAATMVAAVKMLDEVGLDFIHRYEHNLISYAIDGLRSIPGIELYSCCEQNEKRVSLISFIMQGIHHKMLADILSAEAAIAVRNGLFCAHPYVERLLKLSNADINYYYNNPNARFPGLVRISLGIYNNYHEIDILLALLNDIARNKSYYKQKYSQNCQTRVDSLYQEWLAAPRRRLP
ncbi:Cysteine desulfurase SufS [bioreactor metagenome]|uniref:Cysteine desulfurase SufS n=1 Tax=bioreactor metagenome TaxID=1076179 RepID=A0A645GLV8_9ZZZZ